MITIRIPVTTLSRGGEGEALVTAGAAHGPLPATPGRGGLVRGEHGRATTPLTEPAATTPTTPAPAAVLLAIIAACRGEGNEAVRRARGGGRVAASTPTPAIAIGARGWTGHDEEARAGGRPGLLGLLRVASQEGVWEAAHVWGLCWGGNWRGAPPGLASPLSTCLCLHAKRPHGPPTHENKQG